MVPLAHAQAQHDVEGAEALRLHKLAAARAQRQAHEAHALDVQLHEEGLALSRRLVAAGRERALMLARREAASDAVGQHHQWVQSLSASCAMGLGAVYSTVLQGLLLIPPSGSIGVSVLLALACGAAVALLSVAMWLTLKVGRRLAQFQIYVPETVYACGGTHPTFDSFFVCHCRQLERWVIALFDIGTMCVVSCAVLMVVAAQIPTLDAGGNGVSLTVPLVLTAIGVMLALWVRIGLK
jgi:hypothetical protein